MIALDEAIARHSRDCEIWDREKLGWENGIFPKGCPERFHSGTYEQYDGERPLLEDYEGSP